MYDLPTPMTRADLEQPAVTLGFIPLSDCAPLVIAHERGLFARHGLEVTLAKETSWANVRDKLAVGILDGAQMLASMPLTSSLGLGPIHKPTLTALSLDLNGNAITVSDALYRVLDEIGGAPAAALKTLIDTRRRRGLAPLTFAVVFPTSTHSYELRYWLAAAGIDPDRDIRLVVIPPPQMVSALRDYRIDGMCVGEPWNGVAVREGLGRVLITKYELWNNSPEKVFGVNQEWAERNANTHQALLMALLEAGQWVDRPENRLEVVDILAQPCYVNAPREVIRMSMLGTFQYARTEFPRSLPDFNVFHRYAANFPWRSHAVWLLTQMYRWGHLDRIVDMHQIAHQSYRPDLYRKAAQAMQLACPKDDYKTEGHHSGDWYLDGIEMASDRFFDGRCFDPADPVGYLRGFELGSTRLDLDTLQSANPPRNLQCREALAGAPGS